MIFVDFVVLRENFWFLPPKIRSRRHVGAGWFLTTALVGMLLSQNIIDPPIWEQGPLLPARRWPHAKMSHQATGG